MTSVTSPATPTSNELLASSLNNEKDNGKNGSTICETDGCGGKFLLDAKIKQEEPLDIDDTAPADNTKRMPIISLTPTSKLLATPNPTDPKRKFVCPYDNCGKSYGKSSHLRSHLTWHTGIKPFVCQEANCGKGFTRSDELNRHVRTHTGEKPFECVQCTKKFSRSDHLTKHLATHVKQQKTPKRNSNNAINMSDTTVPRPTVRQNLKLADTNNVTGHVMTVIPSNGKKQQMDSTSTFAKEAFKINLQSRGNFDEQESPTFTHQPIKIKLERPENSSEYQIVPTSVAKHTQSAQDVDRSANAEAKNELIVGDDEIMPEANALPALPLEVCIKDEPVEPETEGPFHCEHCFRTFRRETDLNRHRHVHSEGRNLASHMPLAPEENGGIDTNIFHSLADLADSRTSQSYLDPERPFSCKECIKAFRRQDDLYRHMRTHTGEKPYACNECDRRFIRSDHLKKHMQTHIRLR